MSDFFFYIQNILSQHVILAPVLYWIVHVLLAVCFLPCSPRTFMAGALWGTGKGFLVSVFSAFSSTCVTFILSRFFFKERVYRFLSQRHPSIDGFIEQITHHKGKLIATSQLIPTLPGSSLGYLFGLTDISFRLYVFYLLLFMLPLQLLYVMFGSVLTTFYFGQISWILCGLVLIGGASFFLYYQYRLKHRRE